MLSCRCIRAIILLLFVVVVVVGVARKHCGRSLPVPTHLLLSSAAMRSGLPMRHDCCCCDHLPRHKLLATSPQLIQGRARKVKLYSVCSLPGAILSNRAERWSARKGPVPRGRIIRGRMRWVRLQDAG